MAATITASGTWTTLNVDLTGMVATGPNVPHADKMQFEQLKSQDFPEIVQFLQLMATNYGIGYQPAKALFDAIWHGIMNREAPTAQLTPTYP